MTNIDVLVCCSSSPGYFTITDRRGILPGSSLAPQGLCQFLEPFLQLQRKLLITLFTNRLHVKLNKLVPANKERQTMSIPNM